MHYVSPKLDISTLDYSKHEKDKIFVKAQHSARQSLKP